MPMKLLTHNNAHNSKALRSIIETLRAPSRNLKKNHHLSFLALLDIIKEQRGLDFHHYQQELLKRRLAIRMRTTGITYYEDYVRLLLNTPEEYDRLFEVMCISVSEFFRDNDVWNRIRLIFIEILFAKSREADSTFRIWSAGCAHGEEPNTIAIVLKELLSPDTLDSTAEVIATDIDKKSLSCAMNGEYGADAVKNVDKQFLARNFDYDGGIFRVRRDVKNLITYRYLDLTSNELVRGCDVVFCRNVFIYFDRDLQEQLLKKFHEALKPGGYLILGKSETLLREAGGLFQEVDSEARIYRKI
jgi:chemotaxis methyl-accepting protein methylase